MAVDRDAILKQAEKLLRQGKLEGAIAEYVRLVEDQPRDWNALNALGDLYARAGQADQAVAQFTKIADHLFAEGFLAKAAALYRKALKVKPDDEKTLLQLAETAARQGLNADARSSLRQLAKQRSARGDHQGALDCVLRLGSLEDADPEAQTAAAQAADTLGLKDRAAVLYQAAAAGFVKAGQLDRVKAFITREAAGDDPDLLMLAASNELQSGRVQDARATLVRLLTVAPTRRADIVALAEEIAVAGQDEAAFGCVEMVVDEAVLSGEWDSAIAALDSFTSRCPYIPALMKLVEIAIDAEQDAPMRMAQARLADAYLAAGQGGEARPIAEDLLAHDPRSEAHIYRLRRALEQVGEADIDRILERYREPAGPLEDALDLDLAELDVPAPAPEPLPERLPEPAAAAAPEPAPRRVVPPEPVDDDDPSGEVVVEQAVPAVASRAAADAPIVIDISEIDLSQALSELLAADGTGDAEPAPDLEDVFEGMRGRAARDREVADALDKYERGVRHLEAGRQQQAIADLSSAARMPMLRFAAAAKLGRLHLSRGDRDQAIEWLERAAEAPASEPEEGVAVLYELAAVLQDAGETARALAILMEIDADIASYRDVPQRIEQLRVRAGGA